MENSASPFQFEDFDCAGKSASDNADLRFSAEELKKAMEDGYAKGFREAEILARHRSATTAELISNDLAQLKEEQSEFFRAEKTRLADIASALTTKICADVLTANERSSAISLINHYTDLAMQFQPVRLHLTSSLTDNDRVDIKSHAEKKRLDDFVLIDEETQDPDSESASIMKLSWPRGSLNFDIDLVLQEISEAFASNTTKTTKTPGEEK